MFSTFTVQRLSVGSIYKIIFIGLLTSHVFLGLIFGVLAFFGFDTVRWNSVPVQGTYGLLLGPLIGLALALFFSAFLGTSAALGLWLYSRFRPLSLVGKNMQLTSSESV